MTRAACLVLAFCACTAGSPEVIDALVAPFPGADGADTAAAEPRVDAAALDDVAAGARADGAAELDAREPGDAPGDVGDAEGAGDTVAPLEDTAASLEDAPDPLEDAPDPLEDAPEDLPDSASPDSASPDSASPDAGPPDAGPSADVDPCGPSSCVATQLPVPPAAPVEPPGVGGCPAGMTRIAASPPFCVDRWEAAIVAADGSPLTPFVPPPADGRAVSAPGVTPHGYVSGTRAASACAAAGKRLCTDAEWLRACQGPSGWTYPYGTQRIPGRCNDARACHPAIQYFNTTESWIWSELDHPCLNQLPFGLDSTGARVDCVTPEGVYDLMGNLHEWTADPAGTFRGGFYVDTKLNGNGCLYVTTAHNVSHYDYSTGFRCCADAQP